MSWQSWLVIECKFCLLKQVFAALDKIKGQSVALKFISKQGKTSEDLKSFKRELSFLEQLHHSHITKYLGSFETREEVCLVMELACGQLSYLYFLRALS